MVPSEHLEPLGLGQESKRAGEVEDTTAIPRADLLAQRGRALALAAVALKIS